MVGYDPSINRRRIAATRRAVNLYLAGIDDLGLIQIWSGFRPNTPDTLPIIERNETFANLILATGHDMLGMTHSLITGKLVSEIIVGKKPSFEIRYSAVRCLIRVIQATHLIIKKPCHFGVVSHERRLWPENRPV